MRCWKISAALVLLLAAACVTVNIYFPAAEVRQDAERVVKEAYGIEVQEGQEGQDGGSSGLHLFGPTEAYAQDYVNLNNAATRGAEQKVIGNTKQLTPFFQPGNVGLDSGGFAALRTQEGLAMPDVAAVQRLVQQDKQYKMDLYKAKAEAAGTPGKVGEVQSIYAEVWKQYAQSGWWIQDANGGWRQK